VAVPRSRKPARKFAPYSCVSHHERVREPVRFKEAQENMQRIRFVLLVFVAAMLGALISMVDSSPGWDDTGVSAAMVLSASGLMGALHPQRRGCGRWPSAHGYRP
jgi:hypothetical protein